MGSRLLSSETVSESLIHIMYPVADQAVNYVISKMGYTDTFKNNIDVTTDFRKWSKTSDEGKSGRTRGDRVRVKLNPNVNPSTIKWEGSGTTVDLGNGNMLIQNSGSARAQRKPWASGQHISNSKLSILRDDWIGVDLTDSMVGTSISMEITYEFVDEYMANEALSKLFQVFQNGDMIGYIDIAYDVPIPKNTLSLLKYMYHLSQIDADHPNGALDENGRFLAAGWYKWMQEKSGNVITMMTNRNRPEHKEIVINKNHFQALYLIECSQETPTPLMPDGASITFNMTVQFARSNRILLEYPIIVNNNYVDSRYVPMERMVRAAGPDTMILWQNPAVAKTWLSTYTAWPPKPFMFPFWDPWMVPNDSRAWQHGYKPVIIAAFTLDNVDKEDAFTQFDFDTDPANVFQSKIDPVILKTIKEKKNKVFDCDEIVNITVFADDIAVDKKYLDISDGHTLIIKMKDSNAIYRMVVNVGKKIKEGPYNWNRVWITSIITINADRRNQKGR